MSTPKKPYYPMTHDDAVNMNTRLGEIRDVLFTGSAGVVYGFHIDGNESDPSEAVTYVKDAVGMVPAKMDYTSDKFSYGSWGNAFFMPRPCMLKQDGTVDYYLDPDNYDLKEDGTASDVADTAYAGNAMMEWGQNGKRIWYKIVPDTGDDTSATVYIADYQADDEFVDWAFVNCNNDHVDHFYTPIYFGTIVNDGSKDVLRSLSGQLGSARCKNKTATVEQTMARANDESNPIWNIETYADITLINLLLILIGKTLNTQNAFGQGLNASGSDAVNDSFTSGVHNAKGLFYGTNSGAAATYANCVKVFGMENWWGFMWRRMVGLVSVSGTEMYKMTQGTEDGSAYDDWVISNSSTAYTGYLAGVTLPSSNGNYISGMSFDRNQMAPATASGSASTYYCDGVWVNLSTTNFAYRGGSSSDGARCGAFCLVLYATASHAAWVVGASPSCKPLA